MVKECVCECVCVVFQSVRCTQLTYISVLNIVQWTACKVHTATRILILRTDNSMITEIISVNSCKIRLNRVSDQAMLSNVQRVEMYYVDSDKRLAITRALSLSPPAQCSHCQTRTIYKNNASQLCIFIAAMKACIFWCSVFCVNSLGANETRELNTFQMQERHRHRYFNFCKV